MSVDKIRFPQGQSQDLWPQLPAERAQDAPLDQYLPAPSWKRQLGIGVVAQAKKPKPPTAESQDRIKISFRLLGKNYRWTIDTISSRVLNQEGKAIGTAHVEYLYPGELKDYRFFDVTLGGTQKREVFGYITKDGAVPFACITRHTPRAGKIKLARAMEGLVSGCRYAFRRRECRRNIRPYGGYLDEVLRRLDDIDMLNSFVEQLVPYLSRSDWRQRWAAGRLISAMESSVMPNAKRIEIARRLFPLAAREYGVKSDFAWAMSRGLSRGFVATMKKFLMSKLGHGDDGQRRTAAVLLLHLESRKSFKHRFLPDVSDVLDALRPVLEATKGWDAAGIAGALSRFSSCNDGHNHSLPVLERLAELAAIFIASANDTVRQEAFSTIGNISRSKESNGPLLRRCFVLLKANLGFQPGKEGIIFSLACIGVHASASPDLSNDVLNLLLQQLEQVPSEEKPDILRSVVAMIDSPNVRFGRKVALKVLKQLDSLADFPDGWVARQVAWAFSAYVRVATLNADDLYRAAVIMNRLGSNHLNDRDVLGDISSAYGSLAGNRNADAKTLKICHRFLAALARGPHMTNPGVSFAYNLFGSLEALVGNVNAPMEMVEDALKMIFGNLEHPNEHVRYATSHSFRSLRLNHNIDQSQLWEIAIKLFARLASEKNFEAANGLISGLGGICENSNAGPKLLRHIFHGVITYLEGRRYISEEAFQLLRAMAKNTRLPTDMVNPLAKLLLVPLSSRSKWDRNEAAHSLDFLTKRFPDRIDEQVKKALRIHHTEGRFYLEEGLDIAKIRQELESAYPETREEAARKAKFAFLTPEVLRSDIKRLNSLAELKTVIESLKVSSRDSDYFVQYESKVSMGVITFVIEDKEMAESERQPMIIVPDLSGEVKLPSQLPGPTYKQKQHYIFRRFAIIPLNNTRRFSDGELKFIYEGLKALPYEVLGGFYSVMADDVDYDRHNPRGLFDREQVKFQGMVVGIPSLYHEIGHSVFKSVLTDKQRDRFVRLNKASKTDRRNYASGYATHDVDEDFAETFRKWTTRSDKFLAWAIKRYRRGKPVLLEKALLVAEVLSTGADSVPTYLVRGAKINKDQLSITRYNDGKLKTITVGGLTHEFEYDAKDRLYKMDGKKPW
jgi:hypothetical protein